MKKIISFVILTTFFFSCQKDDQLVNLNSSTAITPVFLGQQTPGRPVICEAWVVSYFIMNGKDVTDFEGYTLNFCSDNLASAVNEKITIPGKWVLVTNKIGYSQFLLQFNVAGNALGTPFDAPIELLAENWDILEISDIMMRLGSPNPKNYKEVLLKKVF